MKMRRLTIAALLGLGACSADPAPEPAAARPAPPVEESTQLPLRKPAASPALKPRAKVRLSDDPPGTIHLPAFTFRTLDRAEVKVEINGELLSTTPCLWSITEEIEGDKDLTLPNEEPRAGAMFVGSSELTGEPPSKVDVYVLSNPLQLAKIARLRKDEVVLIVEGRIGLKLVSVALRLRVEGYLYTDYTPLVNPEGDDASRFQRTIWFERKTD